VEQNLFAFGKLHKVPRAQLRARVDTALEWSNLADRRRKLVRTLSGGMKRRLNIACSVLHRPKILLLDEPTVGVDPQSRERIYEMLRELKNKGTAILLTTHQLEEARVHCDRIAIVDRGSIVRVGTFNELVSGTVGRHQRLTVQFSHATHCAPKGLTMDATGTVGRCEIYDVTAQLVPLIQSLQKTDVPIDHVVLQGPTLQDVFLQLTGKDLRE
jgi:ABC-2 type transport system ATP-binding protein